MISQISPFENAFELIGLHQSVLIFQNIFINSIAGKVIFIFGMLLSLYRWVFQSRIHNLFLFFAIFFISFFVFVLPYIRTSVAPSIMEKRGFAQGSTLNIIKQSKFKDLYVNPITNVFVRCCNSFINFILLSLDQSRVIGSNYLNEPFRLVRLQTALHDKLVGGVSDSVLHDSLVVFCHEEYFLALLMFEEKFGKQFLSSLWPGSPKILPFYSSIGKFRWKELQNDLFAWVSLNGDVSLLAHDYYTGNDLKENIVKELIINDMNLSLADYVKSTNEAIEAIEPIQQLLVKNNWEFKDNTFQFFSKIFEYRPVFYGLVLCFFWSAFPFVVVFMMLTLNVSIFVGFLKCILLFKTVHVFWWIIDAISLVVFKIYTAFDANLMLWNMKSSVVVAGIGILSTPLLYVFLALLLFNKSSLRVKGVSL